MKKIVKICLISFLLLGTFATCLCFTYLGVNYIKFSQIPLNAEALSTNNPTAEVFDNDNVPIKEANDFGYVNLQNLPQHTIDAFVSIEDKQFYNHKGINVKRMAGAMLKNVKTLSLKEGASTISQQLIKNTHLSSEKTINRKLKEIALTKKLEKAYTKDQILQSYLNVIFFGNNCYGLEEASHYYFNKPASQLDIAQSAALAGLIKSPTKYSPIHNPNNCQKRRNLVLSEMEKDGKISIEQKIQAQNQPLQLEITAKNRNRLNSYSQAAIDEAAKILKITPKQLAVGGYKLHTYQNNQKQTSLAQALEKSEIENVDAAAIVIDAQTYGVCAYIGNSNFKILDCKRQPASCLKPLLVYAPAINEGVINPSTQILDEKITIGGYSPTNVNKKYNGYMSVTDAVKNSVNIPAIKVLSYIGIDTGKQYAQKLGIEFDENDDSYALALGGMTYGVNLKTLTSAYTVFPNGGMHDNATFIQYITDSNNKLVYVHKPNPKMVLREDAAYLTTHMLQETAKTGTARKLSEITHTSVASKTGTVGKKNQKGNTDAYNISFTPEEVVGVWFGNLNNSAISIAGGNQPTEVAKSYICSQEYQKTEFTVPSSVTEVNIDLLELEQNHRLVLANPYSPDRYKKSALFSRFNMPSEVSQNFVEAPQISASAMVENNQIVLQLNPQKHLEYKIYKNDILHQTITEKNQPITLRISFPEKEATIKIVALYAFSQDAENMSNQLSSSKTFQLKNTSNSKPNAPKEKWFL